MPKSDHARPAAAPKTETPRGLRPYLFHGLRLGSPDERDEAWGDCPWCGRDDRKFSVNAQSGEWKCFVCGEAGGVYPFLRKLWDESLAAKPGPEEVKFAAERGLLSADTLVKWGVVRSALTGEWLVPGFGADGHLNQLYKRVWDKPSKRWELRPTPTASHQMHGVNLYSPKKDRVYLHESWGNALAFWEVTNRSPGLADGNVLAVANCGSVGESMTKFLPLFAGKDVVLMFDSDHPKGLDGKKVSAGFEATKRMVGLLTSYKDPPKSVSYLSWGPDGYDPVLKSGYDVRDALTAPTLAGRQDALRGILAKVVPAPPEWSRPKEVVHKGQTVEPLECTKWVDLELAWRKALRWRQSMGDALSVMLAVAISTSQTGDQLFLQLIAEAGSAKTRFCDGLLVSRHCFALEHLTGFHSGWKDSSGEDFSLLGRINHKTLVTPEGDVLVSSPRFTEIMSQQRRIFDGTSGASYKNRKEDLRYTGLRTPWIVAGTHALLETDQSRLGDRFIRVIIDPPTEEEKQAILMRVNYTAFRSVAVESNGEAEGTLDGPIMTAYRMTGGYVDYLRENSTRLLASVVARTDQDRVGSVCASLAEFTADFRARPGKDDPEAGAGYDTKELPTRLSHQFVRLTCCLAAVLGKDEVDDECLRRVRKVARDTARGKTLDVAAAVARSGPGGVSGPMLSAKTGLAPAEITKLTRFMTKIGILEFVMTSLPKPLRGVASRNWRLTGRSAGLYRLAEGGGDVTTGAAHG